MNNKWMSIGVLMALIVAFSEAGKWLSTTNEWTEDIQSNPINKKILTINDLEEIFQC